ncbi:MAG: hypothetical protein AAB297_00490 [Acidobacteriota bacterium]
MMKASRNTVYAALAVLAFALPGIGCNDIGEQGDNAEAVPVVTAVAVAGESLASLADVTVALTVEIKDRTGTATSFFNDVTFTDYSVAYALVGGAGPVPPNDAGVVNSGFVAVGSSVVLNLTMILAADKAGIASGTLIQGDVKVNGHDNLDRPVTFTHPVNIKIVP